MFLVHPCNLIEVVLRLLPARYAFTYYYCYYGDYDCVQTGGQRVGSAAGWIERRITEP